MAWGVRPCSRRNACSDSGTGRAAPLETLVALTERSRAGSVLVDQFEIS